MTTFTTWAPPVAVSLLLHAALIALVTHQLSLTPIEKIRDQTITVMLQEHTPATPNKARMQAAQPVTVKEAAMAEPAPIINAAPREPPLPATVEPTSPAEQASNPPTPTSQTGLSVQPLNKLSRPPSFLRKIEPVYPAAEQRAGSQANVLAEVTIDENGKVREVRIVKSAGKNFDDAVINALNKSQFVPGYIDQNAVAVRVYVPFRFNLN